MKEITLTQEELNKVLTAMQKHREVSYRHEFLSVQKTKGDYIMHITTLFDKEQVLFNIVNKEGKLLFDEGVIFVLILKDVIQAGTKNGEVISIDNIVSK